MKTLKECALVALNWKDIKFAQSVLEIYFFGREAFQSEQGGYYMTYNGITSDTIAK